MKTRWQQRVALITQKVDTKRLVAYSLFAYVFSLLSRLLLLKEAVKHPEYIFEGRIIPLWTADAGYIGAHAKRLLAGQYVPFDNEHAAGHLIALVVKLLGLSVDTVMFYAPAFLSPLIVIPIILIMSLYRMPLTGMFAAMLGSIGFNFYFRTHLGYADTDMLVFFFVFMLLFSMIAVAERRSFYVSLVGFASILLLSMWYHAYKPLVLGLLVFYVLYVLVLDRKNLSHYFALMVFAIALAPGGLVLKMAGVGVVLLLRMLLERFYPKLLDYRIWSVATLLGGVATAVLIVRSPHYYWRIVAYLGEQGTTVFSDANGTRYELAASLKGISEAIGMPLADTMMSISGSVWLFAAGAAGLLLLALSKRSSLLLWSLLGVGIAATVLGVRFTTFAVPVLAIGALVLLQLVYQTVATRFGRRAAFSTFAALLVSIFAFAFASIEQYNHTVRPVYLSDEAALMAKLEDTGSPNDFIVAWWDDGWPLWYGTGKRTVIDNGKHGIDNFLVAKMWFSTNTILTANMARYFLDKYSRHYNRSSVLQRVAQQTDVVSLMHHLAQPPVLPKSGFDIYFYFHDDMIEKLPVIHSFSILNGYDPFAGELLSFTYLTKPFALTDSRVEAQGIVFDRRTGYVQTADGQKGKVARLIVSDGKQIKIQGFHKDSDYNLIVYKNKYLLMLTNKYLNTFVVKSLLLNQFDPKIFTLVNVSEHGKLLRLN